MMRRLRAWWGTWLLLALGLTYTITWAHGGGAPRLVNVPVGAFTMSVWTNPDPLRVGVAHVTVSLAETTGLESDNQPGAAALGQAIVLTIAPVGGGAPISAPVTHEQATNKLFYETDVTVPTPGWWVFTLAVNGSAEQQFTAEVLPGRSPSIWLGLVAAAAVALIVAWLWRRAGSKGV